MSDWIPWNGGDCPVAPDTAVEVRTRDGRMVCHLELLAGRLRWTHLYTDSDIIAYRIVQTQTTFDPDWPHGHVTRDGRPARVICTDAKGGEKTIMALVETDGAEDAQAFAINGRFIVKYDLESACDLFNAPAPEPIHLRVGQVVEGENGRRGLVVAGPDNDGDYGVAWVGSPSWRRFYKPDGKPFRPGIYAPITRIVLEPGEGAE